MQQQLINANGKTALHYAAEKGYDKITQQLINANCHAKNPFLPLFQICDVNIKDNNGWTALHYAAQRKDMIRGKGYDKIISQQLINANCDVNIKDNNGWTALHYAAKGGMIRLHYIMLDMIRYPNK
eukprot:325316_1